MYLSFKLKAHFSKDNKKVIKHWKKKLFQITGSCELPQAGCSEIRSVASSSSKTDYKRSSLNSNCCIRGVRGSPRYLCVPWLQRTGKSLLVYKETMNAFNWWQRIATSCHWSMIYLRRIVKPAHDTWIYPPYYETTSCLLTRILGVIGLIETRHRLPALQVTINIILVNM